MADHLEKTIASLEEKMEEHLRAVTKIKNMINQLCELADLPARYADAELEIKAISAFPGIRPDQFYARPLASCVRDVLELRRKLNQGPASAEELYAALIQGGYDFKSRSESNSKRILAISLSKNPIFLRLPNDLWGMRKWYPASARDARRAKSGEAVIEPESGELTLIEDEEEAP